MTRASARAGLTSILVATLVAGILGYLIQVAAGLLLTDPGRYVSFAAYWSLLYIFVSALSGVQHEVTRAAHPADRVEPVDAGRTLVKSYGLPIGAIVLLTALVVVGLRAISVASTSPVLTALALVTGGLGYLAVAILSGVVYGTRRWKVAAMLTVTDATVRALLVVLGLVLGAPAWLLEFLISVPFLLAFALTWAVCRRSLRGSYVLDTSPRRLLRNTAHTVAASAATGLMITGLPLLLQFAFADDAGAFTAALVFTLTITRAPIVVPLQALQSFIVSQLRGAGGARPGRVITFLVAVCAVALLLGVAGAVVGPSVLGLFAERYVLPGILVGVIVAGAVLVGALTVTGAALVSAGAHRAYALGWILAALATVGFLMVPGTRELSIAAALILAPMLGLLVHGAALSKAWRAGAGGQEPLNDVE